MPTDLLLIDDSLTDLRLLMDMMTARQLRVSVALDGEKGYQQAVLQQPSLILLDVRMPGMDGFATCRRLKANPATQVIPVIFLTAANDLDERLEGFALGAVDYIGKPFNEDEVLARVGVHLRLAPKDSLLPLPDPGAFPPEETSTDAVLVQGAQKLLNETITNPPSLDDLARLLGTNRRRINKAFQACCGLPVFGWLREERLRRAHHLICHTDTPVSLIGDHLGYSTPANFTKAFHERFGFPPRDLRRKTRRPIPDAPATAEAP
ncbi:response regulator [Telmatospirillum siberiense]|uniref:DNA-binding response regulator n=1 Tax=Telmatospirillum siberiense TaxID=382514 RepID=A0A2N3PPV8_9PROT|nr:response regulator [Telmatospirillum siberiense]PKU22439.1 DNA-binding response regulator [Telmatospirillum siberiense]